MELNLKGVSGIISLMELFLSYEYGDRNKSAFELEAELWDSFQRLRSVDCKNKLIVFYLPLARIVSAQLYAKRVSDEIAFEDFLQYARVGLIEAIDRYQPDRGVKFSSFADRRIRGAILNEIEIQTEKQQQVAMMARIRQKNEEEKKQTVPSDSKQSRDNVFALLAEECLSEAIAWMLENAAMIKTEVEPRQSHSVYQAIELQQIQTKLCECIEKLPFQEQKIVRYLYFQGFTTEVTAEVLGLSKGRISQINRSALNKLRNQLRNLGIHDFTC